MLDVCGLSESFVSYHIFGHLGELVPTLVWDDLIFFVLSWKRAWFRQRQYRSWPEVAN
jgi:hypothetical protein